MCPSWNPGHLRLKASIFVWIFFFFFFKGGHICTDHADYSAGFCFSRTVAELRYIQSVGLFPALRQLPL